MKLRLICFLFVVSALRAYTQTREKYPSSLTAQVRSPTPAAPQHFHDYVVDGKLRLSLRDALVLTLENNSAIRVQEASIETAKFSLLRAFQPFDPKFQFVLKGSRSSYPGFSQVQGSGTFNDLNQSAQLSYQQTLQTGTNFQIGLDSAKDSSNSGFYFLNPYYQSFLNLQVTQPLLRNGWRF